MELLLMGDLIHGSDNNLLGNTSSANSSTNSFPQREGSSNPTLFRGQQHPHYFQPQPQPPPQQQQTAPHGQSNDLFNLTNASFAQNNRLDFNDVTESSTADSDHTPLPGPSSEAAGDGQQAAPATKSRMQSERPSYMQYRPQEGIFPNASMPMHPGLQMNGFGQFYADDISQMLNNPQLMQQQIYSGQSSAQQQQQSQQMAGMPAPQHMKAMQLMFREMLAEFKQDMLREVSIKQLQLTRHLDRIENMLTQSVMAPSNRYIKLSELDKDQNFQVMTILRQYVSSLLGQIKNMDSMQLQQLQNTEAAAIRILTEKNYLGTRFDDFHAANIGHVNKSDCIAAIGSMVCNKVKNTKAKLLRGRTASRLSMKRTLPMDEQDEEESSSQSVPPQPHAREQPLSEALITGTPLMDGDLATESEAAAKSQNVPSMVSISRTLHHAKLVASLADFPHFRLPIGIFTHFCTVYRLPDLTLATLQQQLAPSLMHILSFYARRPSSEPLFGGTDTSSETRQPPTTFGSSSTTSRETMARLPLATLFGKAVDVLATFLPVAQLGVTPFKMAGAQPAFLKVAFKELCPIQFASYQRMEPTLFREGEPEEALLFTLLLLCFTLFTPLPPKNEMQSRLSVILKSAAPHIVGTMLGARGDAFRRDSGVDLHILFGLADSSNESHPTSINEIASQ